MNRNIKSIVRACTKLNIKYELHHASKNSVSVETKHGRQMFVNWTTPLNSHSVAQLCKDKDYFYAFFRDVIDMPRNEHVGSIYWLILRRNDDGETSAAD